MSVQLNPSNQLGFNRPLTQIVRRTLSVTNHNDQPVAFKVKTTAPKLYCVRPNSGVIEPGDSVDVAVLLQAMREDPPLSTKCKDKFLVQSMIIPQDRLHLTPHEMWQFGDDEKQPQVHQQKIKVVYLPAEGQVLEEEEIGHASIMTEGESRFTQYQDVDRSSRSPPPPVPTIPKSDSEQAEEIITHHETIEPLKEEKPPTPQVVNINVVTPSQPPTPGPAPAEESDNAAQAAALAELQQRYSEAQIEINRLRGLLASIPPAGTLRRRSGGGKVQSDDGSTVLGDDISEDFVIEQEGSGDQVVVQAEGVPLQFVVLIAMGVFVTTYLFF
ncbi:hypothetical protein OPQ81_011318 [Rhizoctonia solani]|nr:hypothetical protein OPQ81_011318 [Rhizoctonia solani]